MTHTIRTTIQVAVAIVIANAAGLIGAIATSSAVTQWYPTITRPSFAPPNWIFGPVWTLLFIMMGIASYLVWRKGTYNKNVSVALKLYGLQLVLNVAWSVIFFGLRNPGWAFVEIIALWLSIAATIVYFGRVSKTAAYLLVPYIAWVSFAAILNYTIWAIN